MSTKLPVVVIVGRPNVGKSTLFNDDDPLVEQIRVQAQVALEEADVVIFLTDATAGSHPDDQILADRLRGAKKPILIVPNKSDNPQRDQHAGEFYELGLGEVFPISSLHGRGVGDLLDHIAELLPASRVGEVKDEIRLAIVGRPNVGKSSLLNAFTGESRAIVSDIPGTTRDAVDTLIEYKGERFRLVDTAGLRRRGKVQGTVEYYMSHRAQQAIDRCSCALIVCDGKEGLTDGDKRTAKLAHDAGKAVVFVANKWDLQEPPDGEPRRKSPIKKDFMLMVSNQIPEVGYAEICFTSAKEGAGLEPVLDTVLRAMQNHNFRVSTGQLNRLIGDAVYRKPLNRKGKPLKVYYTTQARTAPPSFVLFVNDPDLLHFSYLRYLENQIRKEFPLPGTPIKMYVRSSHEREKK